MNLPNWAKPAGAAAVVVAASTLGYWALYASPRDALVGRLNAQLDANSRFESQLTDRKQVAEGLKAVAATTLGAKEDQVVARFRTALGEILEKNCSLSGVNVNTQKSIEIANPAGAAPKLSKPPGLRTILKKQSDFSVIHGDIEGKGSLEQVLRAAATIQAQPWVHRVDSFSIKPEGRERERFTLKMGVATIMLSPDLAPKEPIEPRIVPADDAAGQQWAAIIAKNVFKEPAAAVAARPADPPPAPAPAPPPYNDWRLTGLVESRLGTEAFLVNVKTQQRMTLAVGSAVAEAKFVSGGGERAVFEIAGEQYEVSNGQTLEQRRPMTR